MALCHIQQNQFKVAILNLNTALLEDAKYYKAYVLRAKCFNRQNQFMAAMDDLQIAFKLMDTKTVRDLINETKQEIKSIAIQKGYFQVLELETNASCNQVKTAYKKLCLNVHPDKTGAISVEAMQHLNAAYKMLVICCD